MNTLAIVDSAEAGFNLTPVEKDILSNLLTSSRAKNTNIAYACAWRKFSAWCKQSNHQPFPAQPATVALYIHHLNTLGRKTSTMNQVVAAITALHQDNGLTVDYFKHHLVSAALKSARRSMVSDGRNTVEKPRALSQVEVGAMVAGLDSSSQGIRDRALLLLGVNAGLRASEYAGLLLTDVEFDEAGMDIQIRNSKTDQMGEGTKVYVAGLAPSQSQFDAVKAMKAWMEVRNGLPTGYGSLFIAFRKGGNTPHLIDGAIHGISRQAITDTVVRAFKRAQLTGNEPSSHSLRHSFVTQAFSRHLDAARIAKVSRHKNMTTLLSYDQTSRRQNPVSVSLWN